jgi:hypothetical protein
MKRHPNASCRRSSDTRGRQVVIQKMHLPREGMRPCHSPLEVKQKSHTMRFGAGTDAAIAADSSSPSIMSEAYIAELQLQSSYIRSCSDCKKLNHAPSRSCAAH